MRCGYFDGREYVVTRPDAPVSFTNYLGVEDFVTVISHNAGGYSFYKTPQYHRVTRFRPNGVPKDRPGHYVYLRDGDTGEYWSLSWQPTGGCLSAHRYEARHGLSYSSFACERGGVLGRQTLFVPLGGDCELWDVVLENRSEQTKTLSVFGYCEFSFRHIDIDNQNFQMSLYSAGSRYVDGVIEYELHYEPDGFQYFTADFEPDGFDALRDAFLGDWRSETDPLAVEKGFCSGSWGTTGNHCGALMKRVTLEPGQSARLLFILGEGGEAAGRAAREKYGAPGAVDTAFQALARYWDAKLSVMQIDTPHPEMNLLVNTWTLYQAEINVLFSRFASFIEVGGRTGLGYRDTAQDAMCVPSAEPEGCRRRLLQLLNGQTREGYGLHLFDPAWFEEKEEDKPAFKSPTVIPGFDEKTMIHGVEDVCADDALWLVAAVCEYVRETGDKAFCQESVPFADGGEATVYEHLKRSLDFTAAHTGANGVALGLRADWNDCLNLGGGESAMVSFLYIWALEHFAGLAEWLGFAADAAAYREQREKAVQTCEDVLWDGRWYRRGFTASGRVIGSDANAEGKVFMESNTWAVLSGAARRDRALSAMDAVDEFLCTDFGLMLNAPSFTAPDDELGFIGRVYPGVKENGAIFSHPNPWAWAAECLLGRGARAMKFYDALCPAKQNDHIALRRAEPYSYCQFVMGRDHPLHGQANHPWMTGTAGWAYFAVTQYMLGIRADYDCLRVDPCVPPDWKGFSVTRRWRGAEYRITVKNPDGVEKGVVSLRQDGREVSAVSPAEPGTISAVEAVMGVPV
ncbi:MAG: N,N'-diacetylchitobiose phosphorylase [Oscillospiraceae bacterium]|nr:N,N'-diacetylchitobiose phosphorylase [Oscillospiraceae bacterium]